MPTRITRSPSLPPLRNAGNSAASDAARGERLSSSAGADAPGSGDINLGTLRAPDGMVRNADVRSHSLSRSQLVDRAKKAAVPQRVQIGPTCGLYALGMVMDAWNARDAKNATALVQEEDRNGFGRQYTRPPTTGERILDVAKDKGFTAVGEMFRADDLAATARHFGYDAVTHEHASLKNLYEVLDAGHPAIVAFDVDYNGNPTTTGGARAHYAVIQGYFDDGDKRYLVARHGWGVQRDHVWDANVFDASWRALQKTSFYGTPGDGVLPTFPGVSEPAGLNLPDLGNGEASILESLATKIVEVVPAGTPTVGGANA